MELLEPDGGLRIAGMGDREQVAVAALKQLFTGVRIGLPSLTVQCCRCGTQLGEGDQVSVYAYRTVVSPRWHLARCSIRIGTLRVVESFFEIVEVALEQRFTGLRVGLPTLTVRCCEYDMQIAIVPETNALIALACVPIVEDGLTD